jgi:hypothetical protein
MKFEELHALRDLEERTPRFFRREIFHGADSSAKTAAAQALRTLGTRGAPDTLVERLRL